MTAEDKKELEKWIRKLSSPKGRKSFKKTMGCDDEAVQYEIELAKRVLEEDAEYEELLETMGARLSQ